MPLHSLHYFISAGEPSGDALAAEFMEEFRQSHPDARPMGIAGPKMRALGRFRQFAAMEDLSVMGFAEVAKHLYGLKLLESNIYERVRRAKPAFAILVDYPGLHMRFAAQFQEMGIPVIQFVAPQLWAWGKKRVHVLRKVTDMVLGIMPFEAEFFRQHGVQYRYVGTPQVARVAKHRVHEEALQQHFKPGAKVVGLFPGSRRSEVKRILPKIAQLPQALMDAGLGNAQICVSKAPHLPWSLFADILQGQTPARQAADRPSSALAAGDPQPTFTPPAPLGDEPFQCVSVGPFLVVEGASIALMAAVHVALVASGTATLECALTKTPMAVVYVMQGLTYQLAKRLVKLPYISLVNLVAERAAVREFIQEFSLTELAAHLKELAEQPQAGHQLADALAQKLDANYARNAAAEVDRFLDGLTSAQ